MDDEDEQPSVIYRDGPAEWTADFICEKCGWPWHLRGISESQEVHIEQAITCPNCGQSFTMWLDRE